MKPLSQMTFEEASRLRSVVDAITKILVDAGLTTYLHVDNKAAVPTTVKVTTPKRNHRVPGHKSTCPNPECGRTFIKRGKQTFCSRTCQLRTNRRIYRYAKMTYEGNLVDAKNYLKKYPWLKEDRFSPHVANLHRRFDSKKAVRAANPTPRQDRGTTIVRNTPTMGGHS